MNKKVIAEASYTHKHEIATDFRRNGCVPFERLLPYE